MRAAARRCRCARSPARRSSWSASARSRTRWRISIPSASPAASWAWATSSGLVERAAETIDQDEAEKLAAKMMRGQVRPRGLRQPAQADRQDGQPVGHPRDAAGGGQDQGAARGRQSRHHDPEAPGGDHLVDDDEGAALPDIIKASRKKRIAAGSGTSVQEVNRLLKQFDDMTTMMKRMSKLGQKGLMRHGLSAR